VANQKLSLEKSNLLIPSIEIDNERSFAYTDDSGVAYLNMYIP